MTRATRCPKCQTRFQVTPAQLAAHAGLVRCGKCRTVFHAAGPQPAAATPQAAMPDLTLTVPSRRRRLLLLLLLLVAGALALAGFGRHQLAAWQPGWRPVLARLWQPFGLSVHFARDADQLAVESSELTTVPGQPGRGRLAVLIRNHASLTQDYPMLSLTLTNAHGVRVAQRVFAPADYLPAGVSAASGMAPDSEVDGRVDLPMAGQATGYQVLLFYR